MNKLIMLFKIMMSSTYGISKYKYKVSKNKAEILKLIGFIALMIFSFAPIIGGYVLYMKSSYDALKAFNQQGAIITSGVVFSSSIVLFFGFFYVISVFYFNDDMEHLLSLPLRPYQILGARFGIVLVSEYIVDFVLVLSPVIIFGIGEKVGILYWIYSLIGVLIIPIIPLSIASVLAIAVMRVTNIGRKKDFFRIIGGVIAIFIILGVQFSIQRAAVSGDTQKIMNMLFSKDGIVNIIAASFPPALWISKALLEYQNFGGLIYLLIFLLASAIFLIVFEFFGEKFYLGGYYGSNEVSAKRKGIAEDALAKEIKQKSKVMAIFWREFKILNRVPIFFINNVLPIVLIPAIFIMTYFMSGDQAMNQLLSTIKSSRDIFIASLITSGIGIFTSLANLTPSTSISREGAQFFVSKYIPVSPKEQILGKMLHSIMLIFAGDLLAVFTIGFMIRLSVSVVLSSLLISIIASVAVIEIGFMIDLYRPLLVWDNPQKAVKQNINGVVSMLFNMLWIGLVLFAVAMFVSDQILGYAIIIAVFGLADVFLYKALIYYSKKRYIEIEPK